MGKHVKEIILATGALGIAFGAWWLIEGIGKGMEPQDIWDLSLKGAQLLIVLITASWAMFRFRRERTHAPKVELRVDCNRFSPAGGNYPIEFVIRAHNKGLIRHEFSSIRLRVRGIESNSPVELWQDQGSRLFFPRKLLDDVEVLYKPKYDYIFVEPGVEQLITYATLIPDKVRLIAVRIEFHYANFDPHSAERVFDLNETQRARP